jgi:hypothetical protein
MSGELAVRARTVLAGGRHALLSLPCERLRGWVGLIDDGGEPVLLVSSGSPPSRAVPAARHGRIDVPGNAGERLVLAGTLRALPGTTDQVIHRLGGFGGRVRLAGGTDDLTPLALSVDEVLLCLPESASPGGAPAASTGGATGRPSRRRGRAATRLRWPPSSAGRRIDITAYALAEPDLIAAYAPDLVDHLNGEHADVLATVAAYGTPVAPGGGAGVPGHRAAPSPAVIFGAEVSGLDRFGMTLWSVGADGADEVRVTFRSPLTEPRALGQELRWLLEQAARGSE